MIGEFWSKGAEEASDAIVKLVEKGKEKTLDWLSAAAHRKSAILGGMVDIGRAIGGDERPV